MARRQRRVGRIALQPLLKLLNPPGQSRQLGVLTSSRADNATNASTTGPRPAA